MYHLIVALLLLTGPPRGGEEVDLCDLMQQSGLQQIHEVFGEATAAATAGKHAEAAQAFMEVSASLSNQAEALFFNGEVTGVDESRKFMDRYVKPADGPLKVRGDRFTLSAQLLGWGAYLTCKAGETDQGVVLLKSGWRDWGKEGLLTDVALLYLANGKADDAQGFIKPSPEKPKDMLAAAIYYCMTADPERGRKWLKYAVRHIKDKQLLDLLPKLESRCK